MHSLRDLRRQVRGEIVVVQDVKVLQIEVCLNLESENTVLSSRLSSKKFIDGEGSWSAARALMRTAVRAPMDPEEAREVRTTEVAGLVWGALHRLRDQHLSQGAVGCGAGTPIAAMWDRWRRNANGRARPERDAAVLESAAARMRQGLAPKQRRAGRTLAFGTARAVRDAQQKKHRSPSLFSLL